MLQHETITCPHCWESIEIELDLSAEEQEYTEDCSVCCRPIVIRYRAGAAGLESLEAAAESDA